MFRVICVNSSNKPNDIPNTHWIKKDEVYTVIQMDYLNVQNRVLGFKLEEINIDNYFPYQYFLSSRFRPFTEDDANAEEAVKKLLEEQYQEI